MAATTFHVLLEDPLVVVISSGVDLVPGLRLALRYAAGRHCQVVIRPAWHFLAQLAEILEVVRAVQQAHPHLCLTFLCPTREVAERMREQGLEALHVHSNAFIDHRIFAPQPVARRISAVHVASVEPFKRHPLAWGVENIAVVTYAWRDVDAYAQLHGYRSLTFANFAINAGRCLLGPRLTPQQVARVVSAAHCGLILSAEEGQNNASTEYLLCGVPVVSTPSVGGRDEMFDPAHTQIVEPAAADVEAAVEHCRHARIDPQEIRESVMRKIRAHRRRFVDWLSGISNRDLSSELDADAWHPRFTHQLRRLTRY